jgi:hypothetical protein
MTFQALDRNLEPLVCALDEKGIEKHAVGIIPSAGRAGGEDRLLPGCLLSAGVVRSGELGREEKPC